MSGWAAFSALSVVIWPLVRYITFFPTSIKIEQFMPIIDDAIKEGLATLEKATIRFYRGGNPNPDKRELNIDE
jgi:hypothetical protein